MILVTGATGLAGSVILRELARQNTPVRALVRNRTKARPLEAPNVQFFEGDLLRPETLTDALRGVERALLISSPEPRKVEAQCSFIDAAKKAGVRHVVKLSGRGADPRSSFRFARMHGEIERYLEASGLAWTQFRPGQFMEVFFREVPSIVAKGAICLPVGDAKLTPVALDDVAKVAVELLRSDGHEGHRYEMTGPEALTVSEIAQRIGRAIGKDVGYVDLSPEEAKRTWLAAGMPPGFVDALDELFALRRAGSDREVHRETHEAFGVRPTTFEELARKHATVFRGAPAAP